MGGTLGEGVSVSGYVRPPANPNTVKMHLERRIPLLILLVSLVLAPSLSGQEILTAENYFDRLSETYGQIQDYQAEISMKVEKEEMKGLLYYRNPNLLRIDFSTPEEQVIAMDGENLTVYIPKYRVAMTQTLKKRSKETLATMASKQGLHMLKRNYSVAYLVGPDPVPLDEGSSEMVVKLKLTWRSTDEGFRQLTISVGNNGLIRRIVGITTAYKEVQFDFQNFRLNQNIPEARFAYDAPPSANIFSEFLFSAEE